MIKTKFIGEVNLPRLPSLVRKQLCDAIYSVYCSLWWLDEEIKAQDHPLLSSIVLELRCMTGAKAPASYVVGTRLWDLLDSLSALIESEFGTGFATGNRILVKRFYEVLRLANNLTDLMNKLADQPNYWRNQYIDERI